MQLSVREAASLLGVDEDTIFRWAEKEGLPHQRLSQQYLFHKVDIVEWAHGRGFALPGAMGPRAGQNSPFLDALRHGGIHHGVPGVTKREVLAQCVARLNLPEEADRDLLAEMLLAREDQCSTGLGEGVAIPHVRNPIILHVEQPTITLCFLEKPIDFAAVDGKPVFALFTMVTPTVPVHLQMLSRIAFSLRQETFADAIQRRSPAEEIFALLASGGAK